MVHTHHVHPDIAEYIAQFNVALNYCSNIIDIKAKTFFKRDFWAKVAVQVMNHQPSSLKDSQAAAQKAGGILKYAGMFEYAKKREQKKKETFFNFVVKRFANSQSANGLVTTRGASS